jgi:hypothetical protein
MPAGYSKLTYPNQPAPAHPLAPDDCYYMVNLHQVQAYFPASPLVKPAFITLSTTVESPFQPGQPLRSLYQVTTFQKNQPFRLPINANLTAYLPARSNDVLRLSLRYIVTRDNPFQKLAGKMKEVNLVAKVSALNLEWGAAIKVSEITATLLSYLLQEGNEDTIFELYQDLNVSQLQAGYWLMYGAREDLPEPTMLEIYKDGLRTDTNLDKYCYTLLKIITLPAMQPEALRTQPWWELLQSGKDKTLAGLSGNQRQKDTALHEWETTLLHVREMARKDQSILLKEIQSTIRAAQGEIDKKSRQGIRLESFGEEQYPPLWQEILGVSTPGELTASLRDYQDAQEATRHLLALYNSEAA